MLHGPTYALYFQVSHYVVGKGTMKSHPRCTPWAHVYVSVHVMVEYRIISPRKEMCSHKRDLCQSPCLHYYCIFHRSTLHTSHHPLLIPICSLPLSLATFPPSWPLVRPFWELCWGSCWTSFLPRRSESFFATPKLINPFSTNSRR